MRWSRVRARPDDTTPIVWERTTGSSSKLGDPPEPSDEYAVT